MHTTPHMTQHLEPENFSVTKRPEVQTLYGRIWISGVKSYDSSFA
jgi:hypothetical protein